MALVMGITLPAGIEIIYNKTLRMYDISVLCNVGKNPRFFPRSKFYTLKEITYLFQIAYAWNLFTDEVRADWATAAAIIGQHGYNLYVEDKSYRIKHVIGGNSTPSIYHQYLVGHLKVESPASGALVAQYNTTRVNFPATFELCYKTDLTAAGDNPSAKLKFTWTRYYQGQNIESVEEIILPLSQAWIQDSQSVTQYTGIRGKWRLELELVDVTGDVWFDNVMVTYSGEIKVNDPYCMDVVRWWKNVNPGEGLTLETIYPTGGAL
jgi:hypothetical protein